MGPVLVDVRGLQGEADWALLGEGRAALAGRRLIGLIDPSLPELPSGAAACLDAMIADPHRARRAAPECFVCLAPRADDALFTARLLLDPAIPSVGLESDAGGVARYWRSWLDAVVARDALWATAAALTRRGRGGSRLAVLSPDPGLPLCRALRRQGAELFGPTPLPLLCSLYDQALFVLANRADSAPLLDLLRRHGGSAVLLDSCLLAGYEPVQAAALAARELGRPVPDAELHQWRAGIARPEALLLGEVVAAADRLFVHSAWLADEIARRYGKTATVVAPAPDLPRLHAQAIGLQAESCVWAVEMLRSWGIEVRVDFATASAELATLAARLGVDDLVGFTPGPAVLTLVLAMRGQGSLSTASVLPCIASRGVAEGVERADMVVVPDQPSPPLLAEAIRRALPDQACRDDPAVRIMAALGI